MLIIRKQRKGLKHLLNKSFLKINIFLLILLVLLSGCKIKNEKLLFEIELKYCEKFYEATKILENKNGYDEEIIDYFISDMAIQKNEELKAYGSFFIEQLKENSVDDDELSKWKIHIESDLQRLEDICEFSKKYKDKGTFIDYQPKREELTIDELTTFDTLNLSNKNTLERIEQIEQILQTGQRDGDIGDMPSR